MKSDRTRGFVVWGLVALGTLILLVGSLTVWVKRQALDTDAWTDASAEILASEDVRQALSVYIVDELYRNVDVDDRLQQRLPPDLEGLSGPLAGALRQPAEEAVVRILERPRVQTLWENVNRAAHATLLRILEDETRGGVSTAGGAVTLDLRSFVVSVGDELGFGDQLDARLPADAGQITVLESDRLETAQTALRTLKALSWLTVLAALAAFGGALWLARDRRTTLRTIGAVFALVGVLLLVIRRGAGSYVVDALADGELIRDAAGSSWLIGTSLLSEMAWAAIVYGAVMIVGAYLAGSSETAQSTRAAAAPFLRDRAGAAWATFAGAFLLLVLWGPVPALRTWAGILVLAGLLACGFEILRRQAVAELAAAERGVAPPAVGGVQPKPPEVGAAGGLDPS